MVAKNAAPTPRIRRPSSIRAELRELAMLQSEVALKLGNDFAARMTAKSLQNRREDLLQELRLARPNGSPASAKPARQKSAH